MGFGKAKVFGNVIVPENVISIGVETPVVLANFIAKVHDADVLMAGPAEFPEIGRWVGKGTDQNIVHEGQGRIVFDGDPANGPAKGRQQDLADERRLQEAI